MSEDSIKKGVKLIRSSSMKCLIDPRVKNQMFNAPTLHPKVLNQREEKEWTLLVMDDFSLVKIPRDSQRLYQNSARFHAPIIVRWDISYKCNYKCLHCYSECSSEYSDGLDFKQVKQLLDIFDTHKVQFVQILWWEPFLRKDIFDIIQYATSKSFIFCVNSNGFLLHEKNIVRLRENGLEFIQISLHGFREQHNTLANNMSFDRVVNNIKLLVQAWIQVSVSCVLSNINASKILEYIDFLVSLWVNNIQILTPLNEWRAKYENISLDPLIHSTLKQQLISYKNEHLNLNLDIPWFDIDLIDGLVNIHKNDSNFEFFCGCIWGVSWIRVDPLGRACICVWKVGQPIANLLQEPMEQVMEKMYNWRKEHIPPMCVGCKDYLNECQGACYLRF